ncbi:MAG: pyruvate dehydrogenase (acetyl-transferring), homodimeric type [Bacillota bacterium]|nr:pyruvate dehydrogenase (acetyl-transferring), homodimeric type [Bacillota bacterium]
MQEWLESLDYVIRYGGPERVQSLLERLTIRARQAGIEVTPQPVTPYLNTIPAEEQPPYPGDLEMEERLENWIRWNAIAMVVKANREVDGIGGHLSTYQSASTLYQVALNHFIRGPHGDDPGDLVYFQGHAAPGMYARAFLEGRLTEEHLEYFRREIVSDKGLSSYPHPWLMPEFWQFPTVSMGLGPLQAVYQARFNRYLRDRGIKDTSKTRVWAFLGDGEMDEPEAMAAVRMAGREHLDNVVFVVNCNLQRLDGPVRGNGKIVQELESFFRGAGWNVIKVLWSSDWDPIFARDKDGLLAKRLGEILDGDLQKYQAAGGAYMREHLFNTPELKELVKNLSDDQLAKLRRGGHDPIKVYAGYHAALQHKGAPSVVLVQTVKGWGLVGGEARNVAHELKTMSDEDLLLFRDRFQLPIPDEEVTKLAFLKPKEDSPEMEYILRRKEELGGGLPQRNPRFTTLEKVPDQPFAEFKEGSQRKVSTTMVAVRLLTNLLRDKEMGRYIVPIVPDEARTFGMESLFRLVGIYSPVGQLYDPVDSDTLLPYKEAVTGQILEEGITEAGSMASFMAAGTAGYTFRVPMIPFYWFYSMFGLQRVGDLVWAAGELRTKGFLIGGLSGRTQLAGEGLQHQDGNSHVLALPVPNLLAYDPAYAYEIAAIIRHGLQKMFVEGKDVFYYLTVGNENYAQPPMPKGNDVEEGIIKGLYLFRSAKDLDAKKGPAVQLVGSGAVLNEVVRAQELLLEEGVAADVWSATSYKRLHREATQLQRQAMYQPGKKMKEISHLEKTLGKAEGPVVAASDYVRALPDIIGRHLKKPFYTLGTDGFGRSDSRPALRRFFEVAGEHVAYGALYALAQEGSLPWDAVKRAQKKWEIVPDKPDPVES